MGVNGLDAAEAQWRAQFEAMKSALADLRLPPCDPSPLDSDDENVGYSSGATAQDVWDFVSDDEGDAYSADYVVPPAVAPDTGAPYGAEWFVNKCSALATQQGLSSDSLHNQILRILAAELADDELQAQLTDLVGLDDLDFVIELLAHRSEIVTAAHFQNIPASEPSPGWRFLTKAEREEALRVQDYEHKNAALAPSLAREPRYPHVFKEYEAGNSLSHSGRKYALPQGSERKLFEKYEEYSIPARNNTAYAPVQELVRIADMDGLCRNTFKGYNTLNRMQSLVYPVAYKTNENMLICAPTGAVSTYLDRAQILGLGYGKMRKHRLLRFY